MAMLLNVLWYHQGGSSEVGQALRVILGIGEYDRLTDDQVAEAKWIDGLLGAASSVSIGELDAYQAWHRGHQSTHACVQQASEAWQAACAWQREKDRQQRDKLLTALRHVLEDDGLVPRASSACRKVVAAAIAEAEAQSD